MRFKEKGERLYENLYAVVRRMSAINRRVREFKRKISGGNDKGAASCNEKVLCSLQSPKSCVS